MSRIIFGLLLFLSIFTQATFLPAHNPLTFSPDLALILLFMWAGYCGPREALGWIFVAGITIDILGADPLGTNALALVVVAVLGGLARSRMYLSVFVPMILVMMATVVHGVLLYALRGSMPNLTIIWQALSHALIVPFIYIFMRRLARDY